MFQIITPAHEKEIRKLIDKVSIVDITEITAGLCKIVKQIYTDIPEKKRISYGRYSIILKMGIFMYSLLVKKGIDIEAFAGCLFENFTTDQCPELKHAVAF